MVDVCKGVSEERKLDKVQLTCYSRLNRNVNLSAELYRDVQQVPILPPEVHLPKLGHPVEAGKR